MITRLAISGYRALRDMRLALGPVTAVTGANGSGKSSLYRALRLLADIAQGRIVASLAGEGGLTSTLWAGPEAFSRAMKAGELPVQGTGAEGPDQPQARLCRRRLRLRHRSRPAIVCKRAVRPRSRDQGRDAMDRREARPAERVRGAPWADRAHPRRQRRLAAGVRSSRSLRQHDDPLRRSARIARAPVSARAHARLALLRSFRYRPRCA